MSDPVDAAIRIGRQLIAIERELVCHAPLTLQQSVTLQEIAREPRELGVLATAMGASASAMTRLVDGLEKKGLAQRERQTADRRRVTVNLTDDGISQANALEARTRSTVARAIALIPGEQRPVVAEALEILRGALCQVRDGQGPARG